MKRLRDCMPAWRRVTVASAFWPGVAVIFLTSSSALAQETGDPQRGRAIFEQNCAMCHGDDAAGMMGIHPSLRGAIERLSREGVDITIRKGRDVAPPMPAFEGRLSDDDIADVIAYLDALPVGPRNFGPGAEMMGDMGDMMGGSGMDPGGWIPWLLAGVLAIALTGAIVVATRPGVGRAGRSSQAIRILEERYARGEITDEEFEERRRTLLG